MAYALILAAVSETEYDIFRACFDSVESNLVGENTYLNARKVEVTTHYYLSAGTGFEELDQAMFELLDSGEIINESYWHPFRPPFYQSAQSVQPKIVDFKSAFDQVLLQVPEDKREYWNMDFLPIIEILDFIRDNIGPILLEKPYEEREGAHD
ncbi:MAG: hypothetical protein IPP17_26855 [Bacteroidetes bacterium]|nr:hypothetical protein [Bacteroidota bacterium]